MLFCLLFALYCCLCFFGWSLVRVSAKAETQSRHQEPLYSQETISDPTQAVSQMLPYTR